MWAATAGQSIAPPAVNGSSTADMPVIARRGRMRAATSFGSASDGTAATPSVGLRVACAVRLRIG